MEQQVSSNNHSEFINNEGQLDAMKENVIENIADINEYTKQTDNFHDVSSKRKRLLFVIINITKMFIIIILIILIIFMMD